MSVEIRAARELKMVMSDAGRRAIRRLSLRLLTSQPREEDLRDASDLLSQLVEGETDLMIDADVSQSVIVVASPPPSRREGAG